MVRALSRSHCLLTPAFSRSVDLDNYMYRIASYIIHVHSILSETVYYLFWVNWTNIAVQFLAAVVYEIENAVCMQAFPNFSLVCDSRCMENREFS